MLKSPEEYLSTMSFEAGDAQDRDTRLDAGERAFVEKYLGLDALRDFPPQSPEPEPLPEPKILPAPLPVKEPEIIIIQPPLAAQAAPVTPQPVLEISAPPVTPQKTAPAPGRGLLAAQKLAQRKATATVVEIREAQIAAPPVTAPVETALTDAQASRQKAEVEIAQEAAAKSSIAEATQIDADTTLRPDAAQTAPHLEITAKSRSASTLAPSSSRTLAIKTNEDQLASQASPQPVELPLREKWRQAAEIQVVSFFVAGQLFLLPVEGIQEVVRHMDLVKVPQAPDFIAGAINLRGAVMPLVRLSTLLTNEPDAPYDRKNFIIITGTDKLRMGLIIDKVSSMHMIPQQKIIWNAESKLGDAAEFLSAIVNLDDMVCGMVAPEAIAQKILPEL